jgi:DNA invertase Pin-like site-specific DNA recombinase
LDSPEFSVPYPSNNLYQYSEAKLSIIYGYSRVSTSLIANKQSLKLQNDALIAAGVDPSNIFSDRLSGSRKDRPSQLRLLEIVEPGDSIYVWKLDRWARSLSHASSTLDFLDDRKVGFRSLTEGLDTTEGGAVSRLLAGLLSSIAQFERDLNSERTRAGMEASGNKGGRPRSLTPDNDLLIRRMKNDLVPVSQIARQFSVSRVSVYRSLISTEPADVADVFPAA